jgi:hypothetical protein
VNERLLNAAIALINENTVGDDEAWEESQATAECRQAVMAAEAEIAERERPVTEEWLDAPDGPGWWWMLMTKDDEPDCIKLFAIPGAGLACTDGPSVNYYESAKWQRVIGPSE